MIGTLLAVVSESWTFARSREGHPAFATARTHLAFGAAPLVLIAIGYAWRPGDHVELAKTKWGKLSLSAVAVSLLIARADGWATS